MERFRLNIASNSEGSAQCGVDTRNGVRGSKYRIDRQRTVTFFFTNSLSVFGLVIASFKTEAKLSVAGRY